MPLNLISDEGAENLQHYYQKSLTDKNNQAIDRYEAHFTLGLLAWRAGNVAEVNSLLSAAANEAVEIIALRDVNNITAERIPHSVAMPFLVVINFGSDACVQRLTKLSRSQWFQPETDEYKPLADLLDLLRNYALDKKLNAEQLQALVKSNNYPGVDLFYKPWISALSQGLLAVAQKDSTTAQKFLQKLLAQHEDMAFDGAWKNLAEGFLSLWAMTLVKIAKNETILLKVSSPYLF